MLTDFEYNLRYWPLAVIMITFLSWLLYKFLAPKTWKEWRGAGLLQAFVIALYAEMYGFPLTIYLLTGLLGIDIPLLHDSGHLWATLLGYGRVGAQVEMLLGSTFIASGALLVIKGWIRLYFATSENHMTAQGVYGYIRHPQYAGIFLIVLGQIIHWPTILTIIISPVIVWAFVDLARKEEARMIEEFGDEYRAYQRQVPMFFPSSALWPGQPRPL